MDQVTSIGRGALLPVMLLTALGLAIGACGGDPGDDEQIVVEVAVISVDGTLTEITGFTLRLSDGTDLIFVPAEGVLFHGNAPISHIRDHLGSGQPLRVGYVVLENGILSAVLVEDV